MVAGRPAEARARISAGTGLPPSLLRERRIALGLSQRELATALGVMTNTLARWERGERRIGRARMVGIVLDGLENTNLTATTTSLPAWEPSHNIPLPPTRLIGRGHDLRELCDLLTR